MRTDQVAAPRYAIRPRIHIADLGEGGMILLDLDRDIYLGADVISAEIIRQIAANGSTEALAERIAKEYDVAEAMVRRDMEEFLMRCIEEGIVERVLPGR